MAVQSPHIQVSFQCCWWSNRHYIQKKDSEYCMKIHVKGACKAVSQCSCNSPGRGSEEQCVMCCLFLFPLRNKYRLQIIVNKTNPISQIWTLSEESLVTGSKPEFSCFQVLIYEAFFNVQSSKHSYINMLLLRDKSQIGNANFNRTTIFLPQCGLITIQVALMLYKHDWLKV